METERETTDESKIEAELIAYLEELGFKTFANKKGEDVYFYECGDLKYHGSIKHRSYTVWDSSNNGELYSFDGELYDADDQYIGWAPISDLFDAIKATPDFHMYYVSPKSYTCWNTEPPADAYIWKKLRSGITFSK